MTTRKSTTTHHKDGTRRESSALVAANSKLAKSCEGVIDDSSLPSGLGVDVDIPIFV